MRKNENRNSKWLRAVFFTQFSGTFPPSHCFSPLRNQIFACLLKRLKTNFINTFSNCYHVRTVDRVLSVTFTFPSHVILYFPFSLRYAILKYDSRQLSGIIWWGISFFWRFEELHFMCKYILYIKTWPRVHPGRTYLNKSLSGF